jgi:gamma-glutamylcyclotransferase (GGCT)/AIG2-like uncharacterized protein YtfP
VNAYFAYGTTQRGFTHHRRFAALLGEPVGRFRTGAPHAVVVPHRAACSNPGCQYVHQMALLVPGFAPLRAEGDLFLISDDGLAAIDALETSGPYERAPIEVVSLDGADIRPAHAYLAEDSERWRALVEAGSADALAAYPCELAAAERLKACCEHSPGHPPPHDIVDPLATGARA